MADRALNVAGSTLAVLMLWGSWLVGLAVIAFVALRPALGPIRSEW